MPGEINCSLHQGADPLRREGGRPEGVAATLLRTPGDSRDYLMADHNWMSLRVADELVQAWPWR